VRSVQIKEMLEQTVVLKLNGGLGTGMGLEQAKSLLQVKEGKSFLAIIAEQAWPHPSTRARAHTHTHTHTNTRFATQFLGIGAAVCGRTCRGTKSGAGRSLVES